MEGPAAMTRDTLARQLSAAVSWPGRALAPAGGWTLAKCAQHTRRGGEQFWLSQVRTQIWASRKLLQHQSHEQGEAKT